MRPKDWARGGSGRGRLPTDRLTLHRRRRLRQLFGGDQCVDRALDLDAVDERQRRLAVARHRDAAGDRVADRRQPVTGLGADQVGDVDHVGLRHLRLVEQVVVHQLLEEPGHRLVVVADVLDVVDRQGVAVDELLRALEQVAERVVLLGLLQVGQLFEVHVRRVAEERGLDLAVAVDGVDRDHLGGAADLHVVHERHTDHEGEDLVLVHG